MESPVRESYGKLNHVLVRFSLSHHMLMIKFRLRLSGVFLLTQISGGPCLTFSWQIRSDTVECIRSDGLIVIGEFSGLFLISLRKYLLGLTSVHQIQS